MHRVPPVLILLAALLLGQRAARACSCEFPGGLADVLPVAGATGVPTNSRLWFPNWMLEADAGITAILQDHDGATVA